MWAETEIYYSHAPGFNYCMITRNPYGVTSRPLWQARDPSLHSAARIEHLDEIELNLSDGVRELVMSGSTPRMIVGGLKDLRVWGGVEPTLDEVELCFLRAPRRLHYVDSETGDHHFEYLSEYTLARRRS